MYNIDFLPQMQEFGRYLFGGSGNPDEVLPEFQSPKIYTLPNDVEIIPCVEAPNGEWVPETYKTIDDVAEEV